jgi:hypothetical protein
MKYYINIKGTDEYLFFGSDELDMYGEMDYYSYGEELRYATEFDSAEQVREYLRLAYIRDEVMYMKMELEIHSWDGKGNTYYVGEVE